MICFLYNNGLHIIAKSVRQDWITSQGTWAPGTMCVKLFVVIWLNENLFGNMHVSKHNINWCDQGRVVGLFHSVLSPCALAFYASMPAMAVAGGIISSGCPSICPYVHPSHSCEREISGTPWPKFIKFDTNVHLDSRINWQIFVVKGQGTCDLLNRFLIITQEFICQLWQNYKCLTG